MSTEAVLQLNSESAVVGSFCIDPAAFPVAERMLSADDFNTEFARMAFQTAVELSRDNKPIDPITIAESLPNGGTEYIAGCMRITPTAANIEVYCEGVLNAAKRRRLEKIADDISDILYDASIDPDEVLEDVRTALDETDGKGGNHAIINGTDAANAWQDYYERVFLNPEYAFCKTGIPLLDYQLGGGMFRQGLYIIGARPGMGKTTLAINIAENIADSGKNILFVSLEMSRIQIMSKRIALSTNLKYTELMTGKLSAPEANVAIDAAKRLAVKPFSLIDKSGMTSTDILRAAKSVNNLEAIVVDYLGLIRPTEEALKRPRYEQMTEISAQLKAMAKMLNMPVLVLCQLNRENVSRAGARPQLTDLRDSGAIEQDADAVILLHRKDYYEATKEDYEAPQIEEIELIVAKNRHANTGVVKLSWKGETGKITEFDTKHHE